MTNTPDLAVAETYDEPMNELETLKVTDRCDGCGAQAMRRVELASGAELLFCNHDFKKHKEKLEEQEARVIEEVLVPA